ncbi:DUF5058 family protein [Treponema sp. OMZ 840]|uniref:DUF5058 family protein n=1 Tax=Treponema sp. OMZ 840 TaxID=244313 RepID=UPI003D8FF9B3
MNDFSAITAEQAANSAFMYAVGTVITLFIVLISVVFAVRSYRAAVAAGIDKKTIRAVIRSSAVFTLIPSTAILLGLITMAGGLGVPLSWIRLSVIGAVQYELIAANAAASAAGIEALLLNLLTPQVFVSIIVVMTLCIISGPMFNLFFLKRYSRGLQNMRQKDNRWGKLVVASLFMGMICTFLGNPVIALRVNPRTGLISLSVMIISALVMGLCTFAVKKYRLKNLEGFALPLSMIAGMICAVFAS